MGWRSIPHPIISFERRNYQGEREELASASKVNTPALRRFSERLLLVILRRKEPRYSHQSVLSVSGRIWFQPLPYMLAVFCGAIIATGGFGPPLIAFIVMVLLVPVAWLIFLPSTLFALWLLYQQNWYSLWAYLLTWTLSALSAGTVVLLFSRWLNQTSISEQFGQQLSAITVGGFVAGYVYWAAKKP